MCKRSPTRFSKTGGVMMTLGEKIKEQRKKLGYTQEALAERMDVSRQAVAKWEKNLSAPTAEKLIALTNLFGTSLDDMTSLKVKTARRNNNYRLAAIILQLGALASCGNIAYSEIDGVVIEDKTVLLVKVLALLVTSAWMAVNVFLEDNVQQRQKNTMIELGYCTIQAILVFRMKRLRLPLSVRMPFASIARTVGPSCCVGIASTP